MIGKGEVRGEKKSCKRSTREGTIGPANMGGVPACFLPVLGFQMCLRKQFSAGESPSVCNLQMKNFKQTPGDLGYGSA